MKQLLALLCLTASFGFAQDFEEFRFDPNGELVDFQEEESLDLIDPGLLGRHGLKDLIRQDEYQNARRNSAWCLSDALWQEKRQRLGLVDVNKAGCPTEGPCDSPGVRDATSLAGRTLQLYFNVFRNNNGSGGISLAQARATFFQIRDDLAPYNINVAAAGRFINNSTYATIPAYSPFSNNWLNAISNMKAQYAVNPANQCNIFVTGQASSPFGTLLGIATFPWDPAADTAQGGLWLNNIATGSGAHTATHELGHCFGLWHTHHGVSEVSSCGNCYEFASGVEGDIRGDFCSDTAPTPTNYNCAGPGGSDCQGTAWGATDPDNFMGYGPDTCINQFTLQQAQRMHCWLSDALPGWIQ